MKDTRKVTCCYQAMSQSCAFCSPFSGFERNTDVSPITIRSVVAEYTSLMDRVASDRERQRATEIAKAALVGQVSILQAVRELVSLAHTDAVHDESDRRLIIGIDSETDHLPVGAVRKLWAPEALREKDVEIASAEARWKAKFLEACNRIAEVDLFAGQLPLSLNE